MLTGGGDKPYAFGLTSELLKRKAVIDLIGSDDLDFPEFRGEPRLNFLNLRGGQSSDASSIEKASRVLKYYVGLVRYALRAEPEVFHILWNNKFAFFDRTLLTLYYKSLGKKIVLTAHNVNAGRRDSKDTFVNRLTLRIQYNLVDHVFVHTEKMKGELMKEFGARENRISVIPFGINNSVPNTSLTSSEAKARLGIRDHEKTMLFFGNITPYKGLEYLVTAFQRNLAQHEHYRLVVAGRPTNCDNYWNSIRDSLRAEAQTGRVMLKPEFIPDEETELYFKAADVLVLPYKHVYQSGVLFLGYSFGLPVLAADVGSLKDEVIEGKTGFTFKPDDPIDLAMTVEKYFRSQLFQELSHRRREIQEIAAEQHSWDTVGQKTIAVYARLLRSQLPGEPSELEQSKVSLEAKTPS